MAIIHSQETPPQSPATQQRHTGASGQHVILGGHIWGDIFWGDTFRGTHVDKAHSKKVGEDAGQLERAVCSVCQHFGPSVEEPAALGRGGERRPQPVSPCT